ncbi:hypothetical protein OJAV_G00126830 [Oryzias javanicus]|uniref:Uncharacterized protein n=1 Tax=Oryzias javanicus TaxID=123683 RepID=A0A3S2PYF7_ORYJA|nr:hypothetical protein OJAV_G00126830 [Oryzias javanicus]
MALIVSGRGDPFFLTSHFSRALVPPGAGPKDMKTPGGLQTKTRRCTGRGRGEEGKNLLEEGPLFLLGRDRALLGWEFDAAVLVKQASKEKAGNDDAQRITSTLDSQATIQCAHMCIHSGAMIQF